MKYKKTSPTSGQADTSTETLVRYIRDNSGKAISMINYEDRSSNNEARTFYFIYNGHGDVTALTDSPPPSSGQAGTVVATYSYDEFGNSSTDDRQPTTDIYNPIRYSGAHNAYYDSETSLYKMGTRYYQSDIGRWLTRDSYTGEQENPQTQNRYVYVSNNPINSVDPTGHWKAYPEHFNQTRDEALKLGFSQFSATYMATENVAFDHLYSAVRAPQYHFGRLLSSQPPIGAYRSIRPWKNGQYLRDNRVAYALFCYNKAVFSKRTFVGYLDSLRDIAHGLHALQDIYAHLDSTPIQHLNGKYADLYDEPHAMYKGKKWKPWRQGRSKKATSEYLKMYKSQNIIVY